VFATDIEIRLDRKKGEVTIMEKRMFSGQTIRKYMTAQITKVIYLPRVNARSYSYNRIQLETRDGKKFRCDTYAGYIPKKGDFGGAAMERRDGIWRGG
jgi:hypothetical protein